MDYYSGLYDALRNDNLLPVTADEGFNVIRIIETAFKSVEEKRIVEL